MTVIAFTKVSLPYGWLGNMSPHKVIYNNDEYRTAEALFQCMRFSDQQIITEIRNQKSPMAAKMIAKKYKDAMIPHSSEDDVINMQSVLALKLLNNYFELVPLLIETGEATIIEDCTARMRGSGLFWGAGLVNGQWVGQNVLGRLWMDIRTNLR